jgi:hypothetical protein
MMNDKLETSLLTLLSTTCICYFLGELQFDDVEEEDHSPSLLEEIENNIHLEAYIVNRKRLAKSDDELKERFNQILRERHAQPREVERLSQQQAIGTTTLEQERHQEQPTRAQQDDSKIGRERLQQEKIRKQQLDEQARVQKSEQEKARLDQVEQAREAKLQQEQREQEQARIDQERTMHFFQREEENEARELQAPQRPLVFIPEPAEVTRQATEAARRNLMVLGQGAKNLFEGRNHNEWKKASLRASEDIKATSDFFAQGASSADTRTKKGRRLESFTSSPSKFSITSASDRISRTLETDSEKGCVCGSTHYSTDIMRPTGLVFWISCSNCDLNYVVHPNCVGFKKGEQPTKWVCRSCVEAIARDIAEAQDMAKKRMLAVFTDLEYYFVVTSEGNKPTTYKYKRGTNRAVTSDASNKPKSNKYKTRGGKEGKKVV